MAISALPALLVSGDAGAHGRFERERARTDASSDGVAIAPPPSTLERTDSTALELLATAGQDLAEGRTEAARRTFEIVVGRFPDSASAAAARRELFRLYAADTSVTGIASGPESPEYAAASAPAAARSAASPAMAPAIGSIATGWRTSVVGFRRLQDDFRNNIGDRIFFSAGSDELGARARVVLAAQAAWLQRRPQVEIIVEGHADDSVAGVDNDAIAARRARAVRDRLVAEGVEEDRIMLTAKGNTDPVAICDDSDCAAQNRRAVIAVGIRRFEAGLAPDPHGADQTIHRP